MPPSWPRQSATWLGKREVFNQASTDVPPADNKSDECGKESKARVADKQKEKPAPVQAKNKEKALTATVEALVIGRPTQKYRSAWPKEEIVALDYMPVPGHISARPKKQEQEQEYLPQEKGGGANGPYKGARRPTRPARPRPQEYSPQGERGWGGGVSP